jgi:hypothetical protein
MGVVVDPRAIRQEPNKGESLEAMKIRLSHEEKMAAINERRKYHEEMTNIAASIPDRIGRGAASQVRENIVARRDDGNGKDELETLTCGSKMQDGTTCGATIYITPETRTRVKCPKCNSMYERDPKEKYDIPI